MAPSKRSAKRMTPVRRSTSTDSTHLGPRRVEYAILSLLWRVESATLDEIRSDSAVEEAASDSISTSTSMLVRSMSQRGLIEGVAGSRPMRFKTAISESMARTRFANELIDTAFGGSLASLIQCALTGRSVSSRQVEALHRLLGEAERNGSVAILADRPVPVRRTPHRATIKRIRSI